MFSNPTIPNLADFSTFVYNQGVTTVALPTNSPYLQWSLTYAEDVALYPPGNIPSILYVLAVYNLGFHHLLKITPDQTGQTFFATQRTNFSLLTFTPGVIAASDDQGTGQTLLNPEWMKEATIQTLDLLKTPWGREYVGYAQAYGPNIVGVS